jgi:hypothetical protein
MDDTDGAALVCWRQRQHREKRMEEEEERGLEIHRCTTSLLGERDKMIIGY